jgi:hypothetical protein
LIVLKRTRNPHDHRLCNMALPIRQNENCLACWCASIHGYGWMKAQPRTVVPLTAQSIQLESLKNWIHVLERLTARLPFLELESTLNFRSSVFLPRRGLPSSQVLLAGFIEAAEGNGSSPPDGSIEIQVLGKTMSQNRRSISERGKEGQAGFYGLVSSGGSFWIRMVRSAMTSGCCAETSCSSSGSIS